MESAIQRAKRILELTAQIRNIFPNDLPYLWEQLAPIIENIEAFAQAIVRED